MHSKHYKDQTKGDHDGGGRDGSSHTSRNRVVAGLVGLHGQKLDPAEENHLSEEEQSANDGGESPRQLDVPVHPLVR